MSIPHVEQLPSGPEAPPAFHRPANPNRTRVDVRLSLSVEVAAFIDAECAIAARRENRVIERTTMVERLLRAQAVERHRDAILLVNVLGANPILSDVDEG